VRLTPKRLRAMEVGEYLLVLASELQTGLGQKDFYMFTRLKPMKFTTKMYMMVDSVEATAERCWKITRIE
jgi:hypothetical protein